MPPGPRAAPAQDGPGLGYVAAIDGLRAVAILAVIAYHLRPGLLPGGFAGVDVFFVISGFVVTGSMASLRFERLRDLLAYFYARRIVRIVPALAAMLLLASLLSAMLIVTGQFLRQSGETALAASAGASNILLALRDSDYFDPRQELNPFLHTWTLGVEEQFYLLFPFFIFFCQGALGDRRKALAAAAVIAALCAASLLAAALLWRSSPRAAFYLMPSRFWELGAGMLLCLTLLHWLPWAAKLPLLATRLASAAAVGGLLILFLLPGPPHVPPRAGAAVAGTMMLIALCCARPQALAVRLLARPEAVFIGRLSYSLYLWHWPVFTLFRWTVGLEAFLPAAAALLITFAFSFASYRLVEQPVRRLARRHHFPRRRIFVGGLAALAIAAAGIGSFFVAAPTLSLRGFGAARMMPAERRALPCALRESRRKVGDAAVDSFIPICAGARSSPQLVVIGDSHANTLGRSLQRYAAEARLPAHSYKHSACAFPPLARPASRMTWCGSFYADVTAHLSRRLRPGDVVFMASLHLARIDGTEDDAPLVTDADRELAYREALAMLEPLARTGARLIVQAPTPLFRSPVFRCADRLSRGNPVCAGGLTMDRDRLLELRRPVMNAMARLEATVPNLRVWDPFPILCPADPCSAFRGERALFRDADHVSAFGHDLLYPAFRAAVAPQSRPRPR